MWIKALIHHKLAWCLIPVVAGAPLAHPVIRHAVAHHVAAFAHRYEAPRPAPVKPLDCGIGAAIGPSVGVLSPIPAAPVTLSTMPVTILPAPDASPAASFTAGPARGPYIGGTTPASLVPDAGQPIAPVTVTLVSGVPEVATWAMLLMGFGVAGVAVRLQRVKV